MDRIYNVVITLMYQDATTRTITFGGVDPNEMMNVKERVQDINDNVPDNFKRTFVSNDGSPCMRISDAKLISIEEEVIYNAS